VPPGVDNPGLYRLRSGGALLPKGANGLEMLWPVHTLQAEGVEQAIEVPASGS
jgi:hypothetical protein